MQKGSLKRWSQYIAVSLGVSNTNAVAIADIVVEKLCSIDETSVIAASILTRRLCNRVHPKFWTYAKPNNNPPDLEEITESSAAMHCIDIDSLDILLLCNGLEYDFDKASAYLGIKNIKNKYIISMQKLVSMIEFVPNATPEDKQDAVLLVLQGICDEIRLFASKKAIAYFFNHCAVNSIKLINAGFSFVVTSFKSLYQRAFKKHSNRNLSKDSGHINDEFSVALKTNVKKSIIIFATLDCLIIISLLIIWIVSQNAFSTTENTKYDYQHTLDNTAGGVYYELNPSSLPNGYSQIEHAISPLTAKSVYADSSNNQIVFTQQVSKSDVKGFKNSKYYEYVQLGNRKVAIKETDDTTELYWFNKNYAYTLSTSLEKSVTLDIAKGVKLSTDNVLPIAYNQFLAEENGDIIYDSVDSNDIKSISRITESFYNGSNDSIRIIEYQNDIPVIITVTVDKKRVYYKKDARRLNNGEQSFETGRTYDSLEIISTRDNKSSLIAKEIDTGKQITLIVY